MRTNARFVVVLALAFSAFACGGETRLPSPTEPTATIVSLAVSGQPTMVAGTTAQFRTTVRYSDGSSKDVTMESAWSSSAPPYATVSASGMVAAIKPGDLQINASYQETRNAMPVSVVPPAGTSWSELPPISEAAKSYLLQYNINWYGAVTRWANFPIPIYAVPGFGPQDLPDAINLWETTTNRKVTFQIVSSPEAARIVLDFVWPPPNQAPPGIGCGAEGPDTIANFVILSGHGHYAFKAKPECAGNGIHRVGVAHGLGHILGLMGHTASGSDLMGSPSSTWHVSPLLSEIINWLYSVPPGTRPE